ncbi:histidine phosphatase family protein [Stutzerimonas kirkiae]|uniref:Histidine phosphatase family protein n=1 Tax=Stutzerimonas kirkiae TaxID=2211392 RepID=A0A4Q9RBV4_9GAMM|nr:alpha-ribazole phosphatase family protein [Stutzerimonas kirkiae]TBU97328.1 histidine phosphatase family protein [Stutzerimonas kirkiae]TBV02960.1 histidine phosphatase family protein [Stutzerimonas kirkiae]TBV06643.1 histidine phosphatase family protein [Stutzerimonas kirkiae]TBV13061.1 histidine phosphatase family protein [Stutzerimonas kirkiae]
MKLRLDLLRHGETLQGGGFRGRIDDALSEAGWAQLHEAVAMGSGWQRIISSPLRRCADFAIHLANERGLPLELADDLRELDFGEWEGRTAAELMDGQSEALGRFWDDPYAFTPPGGEPLAVFQARVLDGVRALVRRHAGQRLLLVTHGGVMRLLLAQARGLPRQRLLQVEVGHAGLFGLEVGLRDGELLLEERCSRC